ncbi:Cytochrome bc1 complex cytochrome c subunit [Austwickia sp. TVS 96-490-7B]|uniref:cytochrome bc1 complex diheme cytochrome c subunit n=1 Tax=Austwickia sp. TVS 96-490-7B TaxID=2830843 RepID=UPI001C574992|nr:cytochrome c [Austwickia sp. TVS 96-490-7B]MBW3086094.1 Cytochrome bc1 complex cytochrome c subunit [Austwickia sp. TVS 96-490-7B]
MKALAARRRHPAAFLLLLLVGLFVSGGAYATLAPGGAQADSGASTSDIQAGRQLFDANCATCHGTNATGTKEGPSLVGVGAAAVDFQVGTGRMPMAEQNVQAPRGKKVQFDDRQTKQLAAYVASLGPGPSVPDAKYTETEGANLARGGDIFRTNCAMCHNYAGSGGALTRGKFAPPLRDIQGKHIYEAMLTGPQSMPVFNDTNITPEEKRDVIAYMHEIDKSHNVGGHSLGSFGPVADGYFLWLVAMPIMIGAAVWLGRKAA